MDTETSADFDAQANPLEIRAEIARRVTFASHQNDVAVIVRLAIHNGTGSTLENLTLEITADPPILGARTWRIDRIPPGGEALIQDRKTPLAGGLLHGLSEAMRTEIRLTLRQNETTLAEQCQTITALARNEWGGAGHMPELLAAFVTPNDPAVGRLLKEASDILKSAGRTPAIDGYSGKSRARAWELASAIWAAVSARGISYALPPASFEREGQKVRLPSDIEAQAIATCLDTTLLFAAALEQAGLKPIVAFTEGHALVGVWLQPQYLPSMTVDDAMELRKAISLDELILFETTLATQSSPLPFARAIAQGSTRVSEAHESSFIYAIDIAQARSRGIQPLSLRSDAPGADPKAAEAVQVLPPLDVPPELPGFDRSPDDERADPYTSPAERLERWKRSLLDLSKRNRLLNVKDSSTTIPIFCPDVAGLEDRIAQGQRIRMIPPPAHKSADAEVDSNLRRLRTGEDLDVTFAHDALTRNEVVANTDEKSLEKGVIELYRKARADLEEGGANTLFLALGMLRWRPPEEKNRSYRAPLILLPVKLERRSAASKPFLTRHDDEPVFNLTLLQMLRQDFDIHLPELTGDLPTDDAGIDVRRIWDVVRARVRDVPGFEVIEDVALSTFSFAKYLMWKDLADRTEVLKESPFVRHLIDHPRDPYMGGAAFMPTHEIDARIDPKDLMAPLNADSSQIVAIHASAQGGDFVLEGPPGTGKSETIGNIIAHNLGLGRRVLFVSEKMAALEVVYRRLRDRGLGDFCLELHSAKANKRTVLDQLSAAWDQRVRKTPAEWEETANRLGETRQALNGLVAALHAPGAAGISPRAAIGRLLRHGDVHRLDLGWPADLAGGHAATPEAFAAMKEAARKLALEFSRLDAEDFEAFSGIEHDDWSNAWQAEAASSAVALSVALAGLEKARNDFAEPLGLAPTGATIEEVGALTSLARLIPELAAQDFAFALAPNAKETMAAVANALDDLGAYRKGKSSLSGTYPDDRITRDKIDGFIAERDAAAAKFWPLSMLALSKLRAAIRSSFGLGKAAAPEADLDALRQMADLRSATDSHVAGIPPTSLWRGLDTDLDKTRGALNAGEQLRQIVTRLAAQGRDLVQTRLTLGRTLVDGRELLEAGMPLPRSGLLLLSAASAFDAALSRFRDATAFRGDTTDLSMLATLAEGIQARERRLNRWCAWVEARRHASEAGLGELAEALQRGDVTQDQAVDAAETAYCRWVAPLLIDSRTALKRFSAVRHEDLISTFRKLDAELADLASGEIRARLSGKIPGKADAKGDAGYGVLARELQKKMRHKPVRQLIGDMGPALMTLTPCLLMSPLSVAQFLPAGHVPFDLVVFDEASQITVPDAIGAIARGKNCIIVGDPKQMPPTRFFERGADDDGDDDQRDLESILDEALAARTPLHRLTGHYRSRHESLICFSNHAYYGGELVTFPAADTRDSAVSFRRVSGVYAKGASRTNEIEAKAVVAEVTSRLSDPDRCHLSIGIVALNSEQQRLIEDLLDRARRENPDLERFFGTDAQDPVFIKNLETVQGDQRDVILLSIGYGPTVPGAQTMSMNFGPLNRDGGERRLNVAITRATTEVVVFASFDASMIDLTRTSAQAVQDLKHYLDFAERGPVALGEAIHSQGGRHAYDSDFEAAVAGGLRKRGWNVLTQIGVSKFRIDLGVVHPDAPGRFLAGVECDGATYHSSPSARDRDRVRHIILERLGWRLLRIWSTDYFTDPQGGLDRLHVALNELLVANRADVDTAEVEVEPSPDDVDVLSAATPIRKLTEGAAVAPPMIRAASSFPLDETAALPEMSADRFYDPDYQPTISALAASIIDHEGPVMFKRLAQLIARAHGFQRTGKEIRSVVWQASQKIRPRERTEDGNEVFWPNLEVPAAIIPFRDLSVKGVERDWADIPYQEKLGLVCAILSDGSTDPAEAAASRIGYTRITSRFRDEIEKLAAVCRASTE